MGWAVAGIVVAVVVVVILAVYGIWTARRLDRLHARVDAAAAALHAQLARRAGIAGDFSGALPLARRPAELVAITGEHACGLVGLGPEREIAESALTRALLQCVIDSPEAFEAPSDAAREMHDESLRATFARKFYNDAVRDALVVRDRRVVRWGRLAGHAQHPRYFEMDDDELPIARISVALGPTIEG